MRYKVPIIVAGCHPPPPEFVDFKFVGVHTLLDYARVWGEGLEYSHCQSSTSHIGAKIKIFKPQRKRQELCLSLKFQIMYFTI